MTGWSWEEDLEEVEKETLRPEATRSASLGRRNMRWGVRKMDGASVGRRIVAGIEKRNSDGASVSTTDKYQ